ncbi:MAG: hypothetical protein U0326_40115 [Polyangiales bacterium]
MRLLRASCLAGMVLAPTLANAQPLTAPWSSAAPSTAPEDPATFRAPPPASHWPTIAPARVAPALLTAPLQVEREVIEPAADHNFQLPTARPMRLGDIMGHYISHLGWVGLRYGLTRSVDVGVGVPFYFAGMSADVRVAFLQRRGVAISWWAYVTIPFKPDGEFATSNLGFTWAYAGLGWLTGPLVSLWSGRIGVHIGLHAAQRTGLGGLWAFGHATVDVRIVEGIKAIAQGLALYEVAEESGERARTLLGNGQRRFIPFVLLGVRFHTRRFAADIGALAPLSDQSPLYSESLAVLPWMSLSHLF